MGKILPFNIFEERVNKKYNGTISVYENSYHGIKSEVVAHCNIHNIDFKILGIQLLRFVYSCPICYKEAQNSINTLSWEEVLKRFIKKYGKTRFTYYEDTYINFNRKEMKIKCNDCGEIFWITPEHHLRYNNGGCPNCHNIKILKCSICGKDIYVNKHSTYKTMICDDCKNRIKEDIIKQRLEKQNIKKQQKENNKKQRLEKNKKQICDILQKDIVKCPFCGQLHLCNEKCPNAFCNIFYSVNNLKKLTPFGFDMTTIGTLKYLEEINKVIELLKTEYYDNQLSTTLIYKKYNCQNYFKSEGTLRYFLKEKLKLKTRTSSEAQQNIIKTQIKNNINPFHFKTIKHISWEGNEYLLRSSYEKDFALDLDEKKISYIVEFKTFEYFDSQENKFRISIPDFYLPETNTIIEIKSLYTLNVQNMKERRDVYIKEGYNFKLILEHKECNLDEIVNTRNNNQFEQLVKQYENQRHKTQSGKRNWKWMHNNIERIKVVLNEVEYYQSLGWILGALTPKQRQTNIENGVKPCAKLPNQENNSIKDETSPTQ